MDNIKIIERNNMKKLLSVKGLMPIGVMAVKYSVEVKECDGRVWADGLVFIRSKNKAIQAFDSFPIETGQSIHKTISEAQELADYVYGSLKSQVEDYFNSLEDAA